MVISGPRRGEIYWADLDPVRGSEQGGHRPVLVIQNDTGNRFADHTIVAVITSNANVARYPFGVELPARVLSKPSAVNCAHIRTIDKRRLAPEPVAVLDSVTLEALDDALRVSLAL